MKISKLFILFFAFFCAANLNAQAPQSINYQAVVRDAGGVVVVNKVVGFRLSILTGGSTGNAQYTETHSASTNAFGLVTLNIGLGTPILGNMNLVTWATGSKFLRVEVDINGGTNFTVLGTTQFLSVPYALYAATSGSSSAASGWLSNGNTTTTANYIGTNNADDLRFYTEGSQKMVLKANGYVGIGTNTPTFKMQIDNEANQTAGVDDGRTLLQLHNKSTASFATTNLRIKTGNTQSVTMLSHYGPTYTQYPNFADYGLMLSTGPGLMMQAPSGNIRFMTGAAATNVGINDRMIITNGGNVGIGTTTPESKVTIQNIGDGTGETEDRILLKLNNQSTSYAASTNLQLTGGNSSGFTMLSHISPTYTVANQADYAQLWNTGKGVIIRASPSTANPNHPGNIRFYTGFSPDVYNNLYSNERMRIEANGNVGIGTAAPKAKLEVTNGDVYVNDATKGIILKSPNGGCWRVTVDNTGNFVRTSITCPN